MEGGSRKETKEEKRGKERMKAGKRGGNGR